MTKFTKDQQEALDQWAALDAEKAERELAEHEAALEAHVPDKIEKRPRD